MLDEKVPWPFSLQPCDPTLTKIECFSTVSNEELAVYRFWHFIECLARKLYKVRDPHPVTR